MKSTRVNFLEKSDRFFYVNYIIERFNSIIKFSKKEIFLNNYDTFPQCR